MHLRPLFKRKKTKVKSAFVFDNVHLEKETCGRYEPTTISQFLDRSIIQLIMYQSINQSIKQFRTNSFILYNLSSKCFCAYWDPFQGSFSTLKRQYLDTCKTNITLDHCVGTLWARSTFFRTGFLQTHYPDALRANPPPRFF